MVPEYDPAKTAASQKKSVVEQKVSRLLSRRSTGKVESSTSHGGVASPAPPSLAQSAAAQRGPSTKRVVPYHHDLPSLQEEPRSQPLLAIKRVVSYSRPDEQPNETEMQDLGEVTVNISSGTLLAFKIYEARV